VEQLNRDYSNLLSIAGSDTGRASAFSIHATTQTAHELSGTTDSLDLLSIVEASQSIAGEIRLEKLLAKMMQIVTANAAADRSVLLTLQDGVWYVRAEVKAALSEVTIPQDVVLDSKQSADLPMSIVNYCARKKESVVLEDASGKGIFVKDLYLASTAMKSVLCVPLQRSGAIKGMLYFENSLVEGAFAQEHLKVIELLSSQIAISIENAEFYRGLEQLVEQRTAELAKVNTELVAANRKLDDLSRIDGLTQIANRRAFDQFLEREWKRHQRMQYDFSLVLCDIDHFKDFNDTYGHLAGDECLRLVAQAIDKVARRPGDLAARYGGEEFVVVLSETNLAGVQNVVQMIQDHIKTLDFPAVGPDPSGRVTLSFGVLHTVPQGGQETRDALGAADHALYQAKSQGRNCAVLTEEVVRIG
jgi:diguanylate cyclase (GGDEF)-like protein